MIVLYLLRARMHHFFFFFFLNDPAPPEISPLPLHAALPIFHDRGRVRGDHRASAKGTDRRRARRLERFVPAQPRLGIVASDLHAFPRGYSADRRLQDRKSTRLNSSHGYISYAVFCLKKKKKK